MKSKFFTAFLTLLMCLYGFVGFAQVDPPADDDPPSAPINSKLIWLGTAGVLFAIFFFKRKFKNIEHI
ncbi:hypothetical protein [Flavobacterium sp. J27]|uniref:hypothetical protein n=1 Tax=Flavobacterium sp. J27 TaxID=2060419 RepID=UPI00103222DC|nr:hypothetical protein [Flavobacterium sp. J27]